MVPTSMLMGKRRKVAAESALLRAGRRGLRQVPTQSPSSGQCQTEMTTAAAFTEHTSVHPRCALHLPS